MIQTKPVQPIAALKAANDSNFDPAIKDYLQQCFRRFRIHIVDPKQLKGSRLLFKYRRPHQRPIRVIVTIEAVFLDEDNLRFITVMLHGGHRCELWWNKNDHIWAWVYVQDGVPALLRTPGEVKLLK